MDILSAEKIEQTQELKFPSLREIISSGSADAEAEAKIILEKAIKTLPERRKTVVQLHLLGLDLKETAAFLHWSENQVRHLLYRGLGDLKKSLGKIAMKSPRG